MSPRPRSGISHRRVPHRLVESTTALYSEHKVRFHLISFPTQVFSKPFAKQISGREPAHSRFRNLLFQPVPLGMEEFTLLSWSRAQCLQPKAHHLPAPPEKAPLQLDKKGILCFENNANLSV